MSTTALNTGTNQIQNVPPRTSHSRTRFPLLCTLLFISIAFNIYFLLTTSPTGTTGISFMFLWITSFLPYIAACILVLVTKPPTGRRKWIELGLIITGALVLRAVLLPVLPNLSLDAWRYVWDAHVTLHGYSPYVYAPADPQLIPLRDFIYTKIYNQFRVVPTIYPPASQAIYILSYLIAPGNLFMLKGIFVGFDVVTCGALALFLQRKGLDTSRCIIYAWCPLPIFEFAIQGHMDASTITLSIFAILCANARWRGSRVLTGFLIALATLTKLYPILFLLVVVRRRDWALLTTCFVTIILAYVPYLILGHGQVFGFFSTYVNEQGYNPGLTQLLIARMIGISFSLNRLLVTILIYVCDVVLLGGASLLILRLRWQHRIGPEASMLVIIGAIFAVSSHIFPWYTAALLPWIAVLIAPLGITWREFLNFRQFKQTISHVHASSIAVIFTWYFVCSCIIEYFSNWGVYYLQVYAVTLLGLAIALGVGIFQSRYTPLSDDQRKTRFFRVKNILGDTFKHLSLKRKKESF